MPATSNGHTDRHTHNGSISSSTRSGSSRRSSLNDKLANGSTISTHRPPSSEGRPSKRRRLSNGANPTPSHASDESHTSPVRSRRSSRRSSASVGQPEPVTVPKRRSKRLSKSSLEILDEIVVNVGDRTSDDDGTQSHSNTSPADRHDDLVSPSSRSFDSTRGITNGAHDTDHDDHSMTADNPDPECKRDENDRTDLDKDETQQSTHMTSADRNEALSHATDHNIDSGDVLSGTRGPQSSARDAFDPDCDVPQADELSSGNAWNEHNGESNSRPAPGQPSVDQSLGSKERITAQAQASSSAQVVDEVDSTKAGTVTSGVAEDVTADVGAAAVENHDAGDKGRDGAGADTAAPHHDETAEADNVEPNNVQAHDIRPGNSEPVVVTTDSVDFDVIMTDDAEALNSENRSLEVESAQGDEVQVGEAQAQKGSAEAVEAVKIETRDHDGDQKKIGTEAEEDSVDGEEGGIEPGEGEDDGSEGGEDNVETGGVSFGESVEPGEADQDGDESPTADLEEEDDEANGSRADGDGVEEDDDEDGAAAPSPEQEEATSDTASAVGSHVEDAGDLNPPKIVTTSASPLLAISEEDNEAAQSPASMLAEDPTNVISGKPARRLPGRRRAPHPNPKVEAALRRQLHLRVRYRAVAKQLKPILAELAKRNLNALRDEDDAHLKAREHATVMADLDAHRDRRLAQLHQQDRHNRAKIRSLLDTETDLCRQRCADYISDARDRFINTLKLDFIKAVRSHDVEGDEHASDNEDHDLVEPLWHVNVHGRRTHILPRNYDSRSRRIIEVEKLFDQLSDREGYINSEYCNDPSVKDARPFTFLDPTNREAVEHDRRLSALIAALTQAAATEQESVEGTASPIANDQAVSLQVLAAASVDGPSPVASALKASSQPSMASLLNAEDTPVRKMPPLHSLFSEQQFNGERNSTTSGRADRDMTGTASPTPLPPFSDKRTRPASPATPSAPGDAKVAQPQPGFAIEKSSVAAKRDGTTAPAYASERFSGAQANGIERHATTPTSPTGRRRSRDMLNILGLPSNEQAMASAKMAMPPMPASHTRDRGFQQPPPPPPNPEPQPYRPYDTRGPPPSHADVLNGRHRSISASAGFPRDQDLSNPPVETARPASTFYDPLGRDRDYRRSTISYADAPRRTSSPAPSNLPQHLQHGAPAGMSHSTQPLMPASSMVDAYGRRAQDPMPQHQPLPYPPTSTTSGGPPPPGHYQPIQLPRVSSVFRPPSLPRLSTIAPGPFSAPTSNQALPPPPPPPPATMQPGHYGPPPMFGWSLPPPPPVSMGHVQFSPGAAHRDPYPPYPPLGYPSQEERRRSASRRTGGQDRYPPQM